MWGLNLSGLVLLDVMHTSTRPVTVSFPEGIFCTLYRAVDKMTGMKQLLKESGEASVRPHIDSLCNLLHQLLQYQPQQRIKAHQALAHDFFHTEHDIVDLTDS